jgi:hypothetical protein
VLGTTSQERPDLSSISFNSRIIVAEAALQHSRLKEGEIAQIISSVGPQIDYFLQVGYNESLIRRGVGHLQEIHLHVNTSIPFNSPIFESLGKAFSPFPGVVWMPGQSQPTAVFNGDDTEYNRDSLVLSRTERFHRNGGIVDRKTEGGPPSDGEASSGTGQTPSGSRNPPSGGGQTPSGRNKELPPRPPGENSIPGLYFDALARIITTEAKESHTLQITGELTSTVVRISFSPVVSVFDIQ